MLRATLKNALNDLGDAERTMRRKMRLYPALLGAKLRRRSNDEVAEKRRWEDARRTAIISVNGRDLSSEDQIKKALAEFDKPKSNKERAA